MNETATDRRLYLESGLTDVGCGHCGAEVQVRKTSTEHTSVQWTAEAQHRCPTFDLRTGCPNLRRSIDDAVESGHLLVS